MRYNDYMGPSAIGIVAAFLLGGVIGAAIGLLFAPKSGKETREVIASKSQDYYGQGVEMYKAGADRATEQYGKAKQSATEQYGKVKDKVSKKSSDEAASEPANA